MSRSDSAGLRLSVRALDLSLRRPFRIARGSKSVARNVLVEIEASGLVGRGEAAPNSRYAQSQESALHALEDFSLPASPDAFDQEPILAAFDRAYPGEIAARCALEMALWDWAGRKLGQPLHELLAIRPRRMPPSSWTISIDDPQGLTERLEEARAWPILKLKLGGGDQDFTTIDLLRDHTDKPFRVDVNEAWELDEAREKLPWLADRGCELVEQPLPADRLDQAAELKRSSPLPLIADEALVFGADLSALAAAYHGINVKLMKSGGLGEAIRWIHGAGEHGLEVMVGCFIESSIGISAASQLASLARWADLDGAALLAVDPYQGSEIVRGRITLSTDPGLGVRPRD